MSPEIDCRHEIERRLAVDIDVAGHGLGIERAGEPTQLQLAGRRAEALGPAEVGGLHLRARGLDRDRRAVWHLDLDLGRVGHG